MFEIGVVVKVVLWGIVGMVILSGVWMWSINRRKLGVNRGRWR